jgi:hypothetical protein
MEDGGKEEGGREEGRWRTEAWKRETGSLIQWEWREKTT